MTSPQPPVPGSTPKRPGNSASSEQGQPGPTDVVDVGANTSNGSPDGGNGDPIARLDVSRSTRINMPEAVYCQAKTAEQCEAIVSTFLANSSDAVIATRVGPDQQSGLIRLNPDAVDGVKGAPYATFTWRSRTTTGMRVALLAAGTSDIPVATECRLTLEALGHQVDTFTDVGVAGLQRLTSVLPELEQSHAIVAVAGMEGALPTVLAGLIAQPIVAVPTSAGYGTSFEGQTALLSMMASCAPGIAVVGIDNGYGAASATHRILTAVAR